MVRLLGDGYSVRFRAGGGSMRPAIRDGARLTVAPVVPDAVRRGDVLLYRAHERGIAHRVLQVRRAGSRAVAFLIGGDAEPDGDVVIQPDAILGRVVAVEPRRSLAVWRRLVAVVRPRKASVHDPAREPSASLVVVKFD